MAYATEKRNTMLGKSVGVQDELKLCSDNIIDINILNRPSPIKEYRNRVRDTKRARYLSSYISLVLIAMEQKRSGELLHFTMLKKQEEKRKLKS